LTIFVLRIIDIEPEFFCGLIEGACAATEGSIELVLSPIGAISIYMKTEVRETFDYHKNLLYILNNSGIFED
jgi:hypothetical protein